MTLQESIQDEKGAAVGTAAAPDKPEGPISAAIIAAGVGSAMLGLLTTVTEASPSVKAWLQWNDAVGPLSGKVGLTVITWLLAWAVAHAGLRRSAVETNRALIVAVVLIGVGVLGTFPLFFQLFAAE
jgi:hypothetical protein